MRHTLRDKGVLVGTNKINLTNKKALEEAIKRVEDFRAACIWQLDNGLWMTVDFLSKHHINKILSLQYRDKPDLVEFYGPGLTDRALKAISYCKAYVLFTRDTNEK